MKRLAIAALALLAGCGGSTAPSATSWADGQWVTVRIDGKPLPHMDRPPGTTGFPYTRADSLTLFIFDPPIAGGHTGGVFPYTTLVFSATTSPTPIICSDNDPAVEVTATTLSVHSSAVGITNGGCNPTAVSFNLTRKGDSLAAVWYGVEIRLVKVK